MLDALLRRFVSTVPGARGAIFCDGEGEMVSQVGASGPLCLTPDPYELRVAGAQLATPVERLGQAAESLGAPGELVIRGEGETLLVHPLRDGYYLVVCLDPAALASRAQAAARELASRLALEL